MSIKINGATTITNSRRGVFKSVNPGSYTTSNRPASANEGDVIYDSDEKNIFIWNGTEWAGTGGGQINNLNPAIPPFISQSGPETTVTNSDGKVEFSLNGTNWSSSLTIPPETIYYCDWTNDILSAAHDSNYETSINVSYPNLSITQDIELELKIDKVPDAFSFTNSVDNIGDTLLTANTISPLNSINAPTAIWGSSDAGDPQIAVADDDWETLPTTINTRYVNRNDRIRVRHRTGNAGDYPYTTTINIGFEETTGLFETADFVTRTAASRIFTPSITGPTGSEISPTFPTVTSSTYQTEGAAGPHTSTDWQIASDALFTQILSQSMDDTSNKTSWNRPFLGLEWDTDYHFRVRYKDNLGTVSGWGTATITIQSALPLYTNSSQGFNRPNGNFNFVSWTVPEGVGRIRVEARGRKNHADGGIIQSNFKVFPKETFRIYNINDTIYFGEDAEYSTSNILVIAGAGGGAGSFSSNNDGNSSQRGNGGLGGGNSGQAGNRRDNNSGNAGGGGSQNSGGGAGTGNKGGCDQLTNANAGERWKGGGGYSCNQNDDGRYNGGGGGAGWFGGGGGGNYAGGGGGSSYASSRRNGTTTKNEQGTYSDSTSSVFLEW